MDSIDAEWHGLTAHQRDVCVVLAACGPATGAAVHRRIRGCDPSTESTTQRALQALRSAGYVEREPDDGKAYENKLTVAGRRLVRRGVVNVAAQIGSESVPAGYDSDP